MAERQLLFHYIYAHLQQLKVGEKDLTFFQDHPNEQAESIASWGEHRIIDWLLSYPFTRNHIISQIMPDQDGKAFVRVQEPVLVRTQLPGDIDILLRPENKAQYSIAMECKRAKIVVGKEKENVNRLSEIEKGIKQASQLREHGFHQTYLVILIVTDGREKKGNNTLFRHADAETVKKIYNIPWHEELHVDVGVIYIQVTQPTGLYIDFMHGVGICIHKTAARLEQPEQLTNKIRQLK